MSFARLLELDQHIADLSDGGSTFTVADTISLLTRTRAELSTLQAALAQATKERDDRTDDVAMLKVQVESLSLVQLRADRAERRAEKAEAALAQVQRERAWQTIETHDRSGEPILVALIRDGKIKRVSDASFQAIGYYTVSGGVACHWRTHWMPLPKPTTPEREEP